VTAIYGLGLSCPLGRTARSAVAAITAGLCRFQLIDSVLDSAGEAARASRMPSLSEEQPLERALFFARDALREALAGVQALGPCEMPIYIATGGATQEAERARLREALSDAAPPTVTLRWVLNSISLGGRAAGGAALTAGIAALKNAPLVLVGGLDSQSADSTLAMLSANNMLLGDSNPDGRIPGEGAAFVLLGRPRVLRVAAPLAFVTAIASAVDPRPFSHPAPNQAAGLSEVFAALRKTRTTRVDRVVLAQSNERFWGTELSLAYLRNVELMPEPMVTRQLAFALGDCRAAAFPMGIAWTVVDFHTRSAFARPHTPLRSALVYACSDDGAVTGALLEAPQQHTTDAQARRGS
jgi:3-oxoacyl-[acyl-carrier-protein] synthase-1